MIAVWVIAGAAFAVLCFSLLPSLVCGRLMTRPCTFPDPVTADEKQRIISAPSPWREQLTAAWDALDALSARAVRIRAEDGAELAGDLFEAPEHRGLVIFFHGFRSHPRHVFAAQVLAFHAQGWDALLVWQRATGKSGGAAPTLGIREAGDAAAWLRWAEAECPGRQTLLWGMSAGSSALAFASDKLSSPQLRALVMECCFPVPAVQSGHDVRKRRAPWPLMRPWLILYMRLKAGVRLTDDNRACLRRAKLPCAFIQGTADATVPPADARSCYEACAGPKAWLEVEGAAHTLCFPVGGDALWRRLTDFLNPFLDEKLQQQ